MTGYPARPTAERFAENWIPEPTTGCHLWIGATRRDGYGTIWHRSANVRAHRVAWELARGPVPNGLCVLHKCDTPACVNVDHLFLGTRTDNAADKVAKGRAGGPPHKTHCPQGHEYTPENTFEGKRGRSCRVCRRAQFRSWYDRNRRPS